MINRRLIIIGILLTTIVLLVIGFLNIRPGSMVEPGGLIEVEESVPTATPSTTLTPIRPRRAVSQPNNTTINNTTVNEAPEPTNAPATSEPTGVPEPQPLIICLPLTNICI